VANDLTDVVVVRVQTGVADDDRDLLQELEDAIGSLVDRRDLGEVDAADMGEQEMTIAALVRAGRWNEAVDALCDLLVDLDIADLAEIAHRDAADPEEGLTVVWPRADD
jgi:hypothetical protein